MLLWLWCWPLFSFSSSQVFSFLDLLLLSPPPLSLSLSFLGSCHHLLVCWFFLLHSLPEFPPLPQALSVLVCFRLLFSCSPPLLPLHPSLAQPAPISTHPSHQSAKDNATTRQPLSQAGRGRGRGRGRQGRRRPGRENPGEREKEAAGERQEGRKEGRKGGLASRKR